MSIFAKFLALSILVGIGFSVNAAWKEMARSKRIEAEVDRLRAEADRTKRENESLTERIAYLGSDDYAEREAKDKLGYKRVDERSFLVRLKEGPAEGLVRGEAVESAPETPLPNVEKWYRYFFP